MDQGWITQLRKGLLEYLTLIIIEHGETYGYEVVQNLKTIEGMDITESTVYPILARLKKEGFAKTRTAPSPGGPPRRYYSLTSSGKVRVMFMNQYWNLLNRSIEELRKGEIG
jgi:PadR family transcriptional regulator PadR